MKINFKKIWWFIWKEDSYSSLFVNIILSIVLIKFIIYPVLGLVLGTSFPLVAVVSCSMQHDPTNCWADCYLRGEGDNKGGMKYCLAKEEKICGVNVARGKDVEFWDMCGEWYENKGISEGEFSKFSQSNGFNIGDIFILTKPDNLEKGDIIVFNNERNNAPIIHRIVEIKDGMYNTKGDHNFGVFEFEEEISKERIYGKVLLKIPYLGWVKVYFNVILKMIGIL